LRKAEIADVTITIFATLNHADSCLAPLVVTVDSDWLKWLVDTKMDETSEARAR
jgi:hypothetical protein